MKTLYKNWTFHNLISHPISELIYLVIRPFSKSHAEKLSGLIHNFSIPDNHKNGRG
jgi:hypothetical protein